MRSRVALVAILLLFIATAMLFVSRPGIEADEALVANGAIYHWHHVPMMLMSYMGALKEWFYLALFSFVKPGAVSLRTPTVILGAVAILLFFLLLDRTIGRRAAWIGALLLATDSMFVLLEAIDYGPNALHFVLKLGAMLLLVSFDRTGSQRALAAAFFLLGLGLWDKMIFAWVLFGITIAAVLVFPRAVWRHLTIRNASIAAASMMVGLFPLILYNIHRPFDSFKSNVHLTREPLAQKILLLQLTMNGSALFGFFTSVEPSPAPGQATTPLLKLSHTVSEAAHRPNTNFTIPAFALACLGLFARASRKPVLFGLLASAGTWLPMVLTAGAGGAAHHVILLWPFPFLAIAATLAAIRWRWAAAALTLALCVSNVLVTNEYYWELMNKGPDIRWTDAIYPLERLLERLHSPHIYIADWGIFESINLLSDNTVPLRAPDWTDAKALPKIVSDPRAAFVAHTAKFAYIPQQRATLEAAAATAGYDEVPIETIYDRNGRPTFDVFRFQKFQISLPTH